MDSENMQRISLYLDKRLVKRAESGPSSPDKALAGATNGGGTPHPFLRTPVRTGSSKSWERGRMRRFGKLKKETLIKRQFREKQQKRTGHPDAGEFW